MKMGRKMQTYLKVLSAIYLSLLASVSVAQTATSLDIATVTRAPFSMEIDGADAGFSIDLFGEVADELGLQINYVRVDSFAQMLDAVKNREVDGAIANISITAERERMMDFTQPIFDSGIQVMMPASQSSSATVLSAIFTRQIALSILGALVLLFGGGMLMWFFERRHQEYFNRSAKDAGFPAFWWALNLVVNGGFEERVPQSRGGRFFAVMLVVSSLFIVSIFVAQITAALTVSAIQSNIESISDLEGRQVGTIAGSTSASFLDQRGIVPVGFENLEAMFADFEAGALDAVVFDGPILAYYVRNQGQEKAELLERVYRHENYGMAFPTGSELREDVDQAMLRLREDGRYDELLVKWFGPAYVRR
jgi:polar amino acid transport system substrate-binding protein